jgi:hypothetical protein
MSKPRNHDYRLGQTQIFTVIDDDISVKLDDLAQRFMQSRAKMARLILEAAVHRLYADDIQHDLPDLLRDSLKDNFPA